MLNLDKQQYNIVFKEILTYYYITTYYIYLRLIVRHLG